MTRKMTQLEQLMNDTPEKRAAWREHMHNQQGATNMSDGKKAVYEDMQEYLRLCEKHREQPRDNSPYGAHAKELEKKEREMNNNELLDLEAYIKQRNKALILLDLDWAAKQMGRSDKDFLLLVMHKARYECTGISIHLRNESGEWLRKGGHTRMHGLPLLPPGDLPE